MDFPYALVCCLGLHAVRNKISETDTLHVLLFRDISLFRAHGIWGTWTLKGVVLCDIGGHTEKAGVKG